MGNWGKIEQLEIDGAILAEILQGTKLRGLTIQKVDISNLDAFTAALSKSPSIRSLSMQSSSQYSKDDVRLIYESVSSNSHIKRVEVLDKTLHPQVAWKEYTKMLEISKKLRELKIRGDDLNSQSAATAMCHSLESNRSLRRVSFSGFVKSPLSKNTSLLKSLEWHKVVETLDLSNNKIDAENVITGMCRVIEVCPHLKEIILSNVFQGKEDSRGSAMELLKRLQSDRAITFLDLSTNAFKPDEEEALVGLLAGGNILQNLSLARCALSDTTLSNLFRALSNNATIQSFDVRSQNRKYKMNVYAESGKAIADTLKTNAVLKQLNIEGNEIAEDSLKEILSSLSSNKVVSQLSLTYTGKDKAVFKSVGEALKENTKVEKLSYEQTQKVSSNSIFKRLAFNKGILSLELQIVLFTAKSLSTLGTTLKTNQVIKVLKMVGEFEKDGAVPFSEGLAANKGIEYISLANSNIAKKESVVFIQFLKGNKALEYLQLYYNVLDLEDKDMPILLETLTGNTTLKFLSMTHGSLTDKGIAELENIRRKHFWLKIEIF